MHKIIRARTGLASIDWKELWEYRELIGFLAWRDVAVRYKQTSMGILWAFIRPFLTMVVFTVLFGRLAGLPSDSVPYPVLTFAALLPWQYFATAFSEISSSVIGNGHVISRVYFPRLILPLTANAVAIADFLVSLAFLFVLMAYYGIPPSANLWALPFFILLCALITLGLGTWFAALHVRYRDVRHFIPFITQLGLYVSPVAFSSSLIPDGWRLLYSLNPMVAVIDGFRWSILGTTPIYIPGLVVSVVTAIVALFGGTLYFKQTERLFADVI